MNIKDEHGRAWDVKCSKCHWDILSILDRDCSKCSLDVPDRTLYCGCEYFSRTRRLHMKLMVGVGQVSECTVCTKCVMWARRRSMRFAAKTIRKNFACIEKEHLHAAMMALAQYRKAVARPSRWDEKSLRRTVEMVCSCEAV